MSVTSFPYFRWAVWNWHYCVLVRFDELCGSRGCTLWRTAATRFDLFLSGGRDTRVRVEYRSSVSEFSDNRTPEVWSASAIS